MFSAILAKNLNWVGDKTINKLVMGALLHNIGLVRLPQRMDTIQEDQMTGALLEFYQLHPLFGVQMLDDIKYEDETVKQIIFQHHEKIDGSGFPHKLSGNKIFPLARIVGFSSFFAQRMVERSQPPLECMKDLLREKQPLKCYDIQVIQALTDCFLNFKKGEAA